MQSPDRPLPPIYPPIPNQLTVQRVNVLLRALNQRSTPIYAGTVFGAEKAKRRAKGKAQRAARKAARR